MKKTGVAVLLILVCAVAFTACSKGETRGKSAYEVALDNGFEGTEREWLDELKGEDGADGENGRDGTNGVSGKNGKDAPVSLQELYEASGFPGTMEEFVESKMRVTAAVPNDNAAVIRNLLATVSISVSGEHAVSGFFYKLDRTAGNAYIITEYDVVCGNAPATDIKVYLYGGERSDKAIDATYICGSSTYDVAILTVQNSEVLKNASASEVMFADSNEMSVGQKAYAIGNVNGGIGVTSGVVGTDSENVTLRNLVTMEMSEYRAFSTDCLTGSECGGGGIFDQNGLLIGMTCGALTEANEVGLCYAFPSNVVRYVAENLLDRYERFNETVLRKCVLGITISENDPVVAFDAEVGKVIVRSALTVTNAGDDDDALAKGKLFAGDVLKKAIIMRSDSQTAEEYDLLRSFVIIDLMLTLREGDELTLVVARETDGTKGEESVVFEITEDALKECA